MSEFLIVMLGDAVAGRLEQLSGGRLRFVYSDEYRSRPDSTPLSIAMPLQVQEHTDRTVRPWLEGLLPDNEAVLRRWAREFHVGRPSPFSLLRAPIGEDCAGAVRFLSPERSEEILSDPGTIEWLDEDSVADRLRELGADSTAWLSSAFSGQFSLAGAQAKTALLFRDGAWGVPYGPIPTTHILKPAITGLDGHDLNEHLCLEAASRCGLAVARSSIQQFGDQTAVVIERYDRIRDGRDVILRIHQEDLCQALSTPPDRKYQNDGGPGTVQIAGLLRAAMPKKQAEESTWRFAEALAWNWLIAGTDAHAKNYSLLLAGRQIRLAPLYDVASALPYGQHESKLRLAMKLGGDYRLDLRRNPWPNVARELGLNYEALATRVRELAVLAPDAFSDSIRSEDVSSLASDLPTRLLDEVAKRAPRCVATLP